MANIPIIFSCSPHRCHYDINVTLEKKQGNFRVDKLRSTLLCEADFNLNNKYVGRDMKK